MNIEYFNISIFDTEDIKEDYFWKEYYLMLQMYFLSKKIADDKSIDLTQPEYNLKLLKNYIILEERCKMKNIIYVTGNYGKYVSVKEHFEEKNIGIDFYEYDFKEIEITKHHTRASFNKAYVWCFYLGYQSKRLCLTARF